jgi:hypothetical protein
VKRETLRHPKTYDLAARLKCRRPEALGYLTLLWDFAAEVAPAGNVGKHSDGAIAGACDWDRDPSEFVDALLASGWIDRDAKHRLLIHDWPDHCERWVKLKLQRLNLDFAEPSIERSTEPTTEPPIEPSPPRDQTYPNLPKPTQTKPTQRVRAKYAADFEIWYSAYPRHVGKEDAAAAYGRAISRIAESRKCEPEEALSWLLTVTTAFAASPAGNAGDFTPHPATWLNKGRYHDDPNEWNRVTSGNGRPHPMSHVPDLLGDE